MSIEEIKKDALDILLHSCDYEDAVNEIIDTYYSPLEASHKELLDVITGKIAHPNRVEEILSNAKKLINDTE